MKYVLDDAQFAHLSNEGITQREFEFDEDSFNAEVKRLGDHPNHKGETKEQRERRVAHLFIWRQVNPKAKGELQESLTYNVSVPDSGKAPDAQLSTSEVSGSSILPYLRWIIALLALLVLLSGKQAFGQIDVVKIQHGATVWTFAAPFTLDLSGAGISCSRTGSKVSCSVTGGSITNNPGGSTYQLQYNTGSAFGGISNGTSGWFLKSAGAGAAPAFAAIGWADVGKTGSSLADLATRACGNLSDAGTLCTSSAALPANTTATANQFFTAYNSTTGAFTKARPTWADVDKSTSSIADLATRSCSTLSDAGTGCSTTVGTAATHAATEWAVPQTCTNKVLGAVDNAGTAGNCINIDYSGSIITNKPTLGTASAQNVGTLTNGKYCTFVTGTGFVCNSDGGSMTYPGAGLARSTGSAWDTSLGVGTLTDGKYCTYTTASGFVCNSDGTGSMTYPGAGIAVSSGSAWVTSIAWNSGTSTMTGNITGNAGTATAFAADPTDCGANTFANAIAASGNLTCAAVPIAALGTGVLGSDKGGTANGYFTVSGPATSAKTFTFPNANATIEYQANKNAANGYGGLDANSRLAAAQMPALTGDITTSAGAVATTLRTGLNIRTCEAHIWGTGTSGVLQDTDDEVASCKNKFGVTWTITSVECRADAGSPTVTPIVTGGASTSILSGALTCGTASFVAGSLQGTPTLSSNGTIDMNITSAGGTAKQVIIVIAGTV